jgi:hypothetical protein
MSQARFINASQVKSYHDRLLALCKANDRDLDAFEFDCAWNVQILNCSTSSRLAKKNGCSHIANQEELIKVCNEFENFLSSHEDKSLNDFDLAAFNLLHTVLMRLDLLMGAGNLMKDSSVDAMHATCQLVNILYDPLSSKTQKETAIKNYKDIHSASWPLWLARLALDVVVGAAGVIVGAFVGSLTLNPIGTIAGAVAGAVVGVAAAEKLCRLTFFERYICVNKVADEAQEMLKKQDERNLGL